jgi:CDP-diacylglycerol--glycerol-3-phosphate 3-phosphatidyltransferase
MGSILISYARARAEGLGIECKVGVAPRPERVIILGLGLLFNGTTTIAALLVLTILTHVTALQRLYHVWRTTRHRASETAPRTPEAGPQRRKARETGTT